MSKLAWFVPVFGALVLIGLSGCTTTPCLDAQALWCNTCSGSLHGSEERQCTCIEDGTLSDTDDDYFDSDEEAEQWCSGYLIGLEYVGDDQEARCRGTLEYYTEWGEDICPDDPGDDDDSAG